MLILVIASHPLLRTASTGGSAVVISPRVGGERGAGRGRHGSMCTCPLRPRRVLSRTRTTVDRCDFYEHRRGEAVFRRLWDYEAACATIGPSSSVGVRKHVQMIRAPAANAGDACRAREMRSASEGLCFKSRRVPSRKRREHGNEPATHQVGGGLRSFPRERSTNATRRI